MQSGGIIVLMRNSRVAIIYKYIPQYRFDFFTQLMDMSCRNNLDLKIIYGDPGQLDRSKGDSVDLRSGTFVRNRFIPVGSGELIWQPVLNEVREVDLVIGEQANKLLLNPLLIGRQFLGGPKFAFWGHGRNFQATGQRKLSELVKRRMVRLPHWWFTYTDGTAQIIEDAGHPAARTTVLYNAIDTRGLASIRASTRQAQLKDLASRIGVVSDNVCCYVGGMYAEKRIAFLLEACRRIRAKVPDFQMILVGSGPDAHLVRRFCEEHHWAIYLGSVFGAEKARYMLLSKYMLMPGLVGLAVLDTFALSVPIVTTNVPFHSPEIEYVEHDRNGIVVNPFDDVEHYADQVAGLLANEERRATLRAGCERAAAVYTVERMVERFFDGMTRALSAA